MVALRVDEEESDGRRSGDSKEEGFLFSYPTHRIWADSFIVSLSSPLLTPVS